MSVPPPPNPYGAQPPSGGPPQGPPPPQWSGPSGPPPGRGGRGKWILGGLAVVLAIALAVVITVLVIRPDSGGGGSTTPTPGASEFASAGDVGPVNIITEDPTCEAWGKVVNEFAAAEKSVNWANRDDSVPASVWTAEQRRMYNVVEIAMTHAADQSDKLVKLTPHRVMRELYEQFIAYAQAFVEKIPSYVAEYGDLAVVTDTLSTAMANICSAIAYRSAPAIAPLHPSADAPTGFAAVNDLAKPVRFLTEANPVCTEWESSAQSFTDETAAWRTIDPQTPATEWSPEQKSVNDAAAQVMSTNANDLDRLGRKSGNPTLEDLAVLAAQYRLAFVAAIPSYTVADNFLSASAAELVRAINWSCKAVQ